MQLPCRCERCDVDFAPTEEEFLADTEEERKRERETYADREELLFERDTAIHNLEDKLLVGHTAWQREKSILESQVQELQEKVQSWHMEKTSLESQMQVRQQKLQTTESQVQVLQEKIQAWHMEKASLESHMQVLQQKLQTTEKVSFSDSFISGSFVRMFTTSHIACKSTFSYHTHVWADKRCS
jgi:chromosome segregation ATPase